jgi:hypothetical protein
MARVVASDLILNFIPGVIPCKHQEVTLMIQPPDSDYFCYAIAVSCAADSHDIADINGRVIQEDRLLGRERAQRFMSS